MNKIAMIIRNLKFGLRNIRRNGVFSFISIAGLSLGMAVVVLILFWVSDELSYDRYHQNLDRIYTVYEHQQIPDGQELYTYATPGPLAGYLASNFAEVECATRFGKMEDKIRISYQGKEYLEGPLISADTNFLKVFKFDLIEGDVNALKSSSQVIITDDLARLLFGDQPAVGKTLVWFNFTKYPVTVGAVIKAPGEHSTLQFKILCHEEMAFSYFLPLNRWESNWHNTSVLLKQGVDSKVLNGKITNICKDKGQNASTLHLFPYKDERLYSYSGQNNRVQYVTLFLGIALIIMLITSINFINLSVAKAEQRRAEVGVRKIAGADRSNILRQFLLEQGMMIFFAIIACGILVLLFLPAFRSLSGKNIVLEQLHSGYIILMVLMLLVVVLILSVLYPSMHLSSINPVSALKKPVNRKKNGMGLKNLLIVGQFVLAIMLIAGSMVLSRQVKFMNHFDLGYNHAHLIYLRFEDYNRFNETRPKYECNAIRNVFSNIPGIESMTMTEQLPLWGGSSWWGYDVGSELRDRPFFPLTNLWGGNSTLDNKWEGKGPDADVLMYQMIVDEHFIETMGIKMIEGNSFSDTNRGGIVLNQEAIRRMGIHNPVGKGFENKFGGGTIAGVMEDFHFESLHTMVAPMVLMRLSDGIPNYVIMRLRPEGLSQTIEQIKQTWAKAFPEEKPCEIGFFDDRLAQMYGDEIRIAKMFLYSSLITIFISCLGLFGLSLLITKQRQKEIGIRKVNGARSIEVVILLNRDFIKWVLIACVIAIPIVWYVMHQWLQRFAYRTELSWWIFALAGVLALFIALLTVSWQSWKAATRNPVESLRDE